MPIYSHSDPEIVCRVVEAVAAGGISLFEFTNRRDHAVDVFKHLVQHCERNLPDVLLGTGSIADEPTAALFAEHGANFIVGPSFNPRVALFCNRRKIPYIPGCQTPTEIATAEELGVEIIKLFPCEAVGGPNFIRQILGPSPRTRALPTGLAEISRTTLTEWFEAGACAVGFGREIISSQDVLEGNYQGITARVRELCEWVNAARPGDPALR